MAKTLFGEMDWDSNSNQKGETFEKLKQIPFLKMVSGKEYKMRVLDSRPTAYSCHWVEVEGKTQKVNCTGDDTCPVEVVKNEVKQVCKGQCGDSKYYLRVYNYTNNAVEVLDFGPQIKNQLAELVKSEDWGDITTYDIKIKKGKKGENPLYSVNGVPASIGKPLKSEEKKVVAAAENPEDDTYIDLSVRAKPMSESQIRAILKMGDSLKKGETVFVQNKSTNKKVEESPEDDDCINWDEPS